MSRLAPAESDLNLPLICGNESSGLLPDGRVTWYEYQPLDLIARATLTKPVIIGGRGACAEGSAATGKANLTPAERLFAERGSSRCRTSGQRDRRIGAHRPDRRAAAECVVGNYVMRGPEIFDQRDEGGVVVLLNENPPAEKADNAHNAAAARPALPIHIEE